MLRCGEPNVLLLLLLCCVELINIIFTGGQFLLRLLRC